MAGFDRSDIIWWTLSKDYFSNRERTREGSQVSRPCNILWKGTIKIFFLKKAKWKIVFLTRQAQNTHTHTQTNKCELCRLVFLASFHSKAWAQIKRGKKRETEAGNNKKNYSPRLTMLPLWKPPPGQITQDRFESMGVCKCQCLKKKMLVIVFPWGWISDPWLSLCSLNRCGPALSSLVPLTAPYWPAKETETKGAVFHRLFLEFTAWEAGCG